MSKRMADLKVEDGKIASIDGYEIGGGGGRYTVNSKLFKSDTSGNGSGYNSNWVGAKPIANTAYELGQTFITYYVYRWDAIAAQPNQILIPTSASDVVSLSNQTLKFGDVVLMLSYSSYSFKMSTSSDNKYTVEARIYMDYTVIKAGTTGDTITLPSSLGSPDLNYQIYTLEANKVTA